MYSPPVSLPPSTESSWAWRHLDTPTTGVRADWLTNGCVPNRRDQTNTRPIPTHALCHCAGHGCHLRLKLLSLLLALIVLIVNVIGTITDHADATQQLSLSLFPSLFSLSPHFSLTFSHLLSIAPLLLCAPMTIFASLSSRPQSWIT